MDIKSNNQLSAGVSATSVLPLHTLFAALLLGAGAVHAAGPQQVPTEQRVVKPYGSGYEARGLGAPQVLPVETNGTSVIGTTMQRTGQAGGSGHSGGGAGGSGRQ